MKIGLRLGLSFGAIVVIFCVAVFITTVSLRVAEQNAIQVERERFPQASLADKMAQNVIQMQKVLVETVLTLNMDKYDNVEPVAKAFQDGLNTFRKIYEREQNTAALDTINRLETAFTRFNTIGRTLVEVYILDGVERGRKQMIEFDQQAKVLENQMEQFRRDQIETANTMTTGIVLSVDRVYRILLSSTGIVIVLSILIAIFITRGITRPVTDIVRVAKAIAAGNLSQDIAITQRDEIGHLADAFRIMKITISDVLNELEGLIHAVHRGKLDVYVHSEAFQGGWRELIIGVNSLTRALQEKIAALHAEIEERIRIEEALQESEQKFRTYVESSPMAVFIVDEHGSYQFVNDAASTLTGYPKEELLTMTIVDLVASEEFAQKQAFPELVRTGQVSAEIVLQRKDRQKIHVILDAVRLAEHQYMGYCLEITDRKRAEEQIKNQNLVLEQAVQEKQREMEVLFDRLLRQEKLATIGQIAGSIAHELRNPLGAIKQSAFFLKRLWQRHQLEETNPKVPEHLDLIEAEIDTSERVIADLLQMTRTKPLHREWTDLQTLLGDAAARVHLPEQIPLRLEFSPEPFRVWADYVQLRQVLINVLTNAVEAIGQVGTITIRAKQLTTDETCIIEIVDTGSGISPEGLRKVFEPLYTTKATGTGLGLSICRQIIESHHGQITLMSQLGRGTTVTIVLPHQTKGGE